MSDYDADDRVRIAVTTPPDGDPVSADEVKLFAKIETTSDNAVVASLIKAATAMCEQWLHKPIITRTFTQYLCGWPCKQYLTLPRSPLVSVTSIKTYDIADVATTFASSNYVVDTLSTPGRVYLKSSATWPTYTRQYNPIEIIFKAGYGTDPGSIPAEIKQGIMATIAFLYENRGDVAVDMPGHIEELLAPHRSWYE